MTVIRRALSVFKWEGLRRVDLRGGRGVEDGSNSYALLFVAVGASLCEVGFGSRSLARPRCFALCPAVSCPCRGGWFPCARRSISALNRSALVAMKTSTSLLPLSSGAGGALLLPH